MDPIVLDENMTLVVENFVSEDARVPFDSPATYIGHLKDGNAGYVYAATLSARDYCLFIRPIGIIGKLIPRKVDTFAKLRQWCKQRMREQRYLELRADTTWGQVPFRVKEEFHKRLEEEERKKAVVRAADEERERIRKVQRDALSELDDARVDLS